MIENIILQNKAEKEDILSREYIDRDMLPQAKKSLESDLIKVVTGPRRAGKSIFSFLLLKGLDFAYLNLEDENIAKIENYDKIIEGIFSVYGDTKYLLFDEIQNLNNWETFVNKLHRRGYNLVLTGSNAKLLSKELATALTGRYVPIEILPFGFREYLLSKNFKFENEKKLTPENKGILLNFLSNYLKSGGYPEPVMKELDVKAYLKTLLEAVIFKDVVRRYKVRFPQDIYNLALFLISNYCSEYTLNSLRRSLNFRSTKTAQNYLEYLEETFIFFSLNRFSFKIKEQIRTPRKIYIVDNGHVSANVFQIAPNIGNLIENALFIEIMKRGYRPNIDFFYYKTRNNKEIDFVLKKGLQIESLLQVCFEVKNEKTRKREISALIEAGEELKCADLIVVTYDYEKVEEHSGKKIRFIPLSQWLLKII